MIIKLNIPNSWNELNDKQLKKIAVCAHANLPGLMFEYHVFKILLNIKWWQLKKRRSFNKVLNQVSLASLKAHYNWLFSQVTLTRFIPKIKIDNITYHAPANRINDLTIDEFAHADDSFLGWYHKKDFEYLHYLAAVLYREVDANGKRLAFDKNILEVRAKAFAQLDKGSLLAILMSYQGCRNYVISKFKIVFPPLKKENQNTTKSSGFGKLILHLSGGKFGTHNETKNTNIYTFLSDFEEQLKHKPYA